MVDKSDSIVLSKARISKVVVMVSLSLPLFLSGLFFTNLAVFYAVCGLFLTPIIFAYIVVWLAFRGSKNPSRVPESSQKGKTKKRGEVKNRE